MNRYGANLSPKQVKIGFIILPLIVFAMYQLGLFEEKDIKSYYLYKKKNATPNEETHIATFNAYTEDPIENLEINLKNCQFLAKLIYEHENKSAEYWCEKGIRKE